jgi:ATP-binding cassette, subfamily B, bacterial MsbA
MSKSPLLLLFLGKKMRNLWFFLATLIPTFVSAILEGASFASILLAFSQFTQNTDVLPALNFAIVQKCIQSMYFLTPLRAFVSWILIAVFLQALRSSLVFWTSYLFANLSLRIQSDIQHRVYRQILRMSFPCINRYRLGDLAEYAKTPSTFIPLFMNGIQQFITASLMCLASLYLMFNISFSLTITTLILFLFFGISQKGIIKKIIHNSMLLSEQMADFGKITIQTLEGLRLIHTYNRHHTILKNTTSLINNISITSKKLHFWNYSIPSINEILGVMSVGSILIASLFIFDPDHVHGIPYLFTFLVLAYRASTRMQIAISSIGVQAMHIGPIIRLKEILEDSGKDYIPTQGHPFTSFHENITFNSVSLQYAKNLPFAVTDLSFSIPRGTVTALVGPSGGGKTSILDMIIRLYDPTSGKITIDGVALTKFDLMSWRNALGVVSQDTNVFNDTVEENIRFGNELATNDDIIKVSKLASAHDFIMNLKEKYQTKLGERGYKLSGGELQRICLARALLNNPQILILDEATSSLDSKTEKAIQSTLEQYSKDRTVLIIAHRLSTILYADQILYIENGKMLELGTHRELLGKNGKYAHLWQLQSKAIHEPEHAAETNAEDRVLTK